MAVEDRIKEIIVDQLGVSGDEIVPEASFIDDLGADSLDIVELVMAMEEAFGMPPSYREVLERWARRAMG